jgi:hypothetical protein
MQGKKTYKENLDHFFFLLLILHGHGHQSYHQSSVGILDFFSPEQFAFGLMTDG